MTVRLAVLLTYLRPEEKLILAAARGRGLEVVTLFDRDLVLSRCLVEFRKLILDGSMERRESHGQPYWVREG